ncbi:MAG: hypothetical protein AAF614_06115 [Chloroflexota bacterium]
MKDPNPSREDDLFAPSLTEYTSKTAVLTQPPWRLDSLLWVAFFGGATAIAVLMWLNGKRLKLQPKIQQRVLFLGIAGVLVTLIAAMILGAASVPGVWKPAESGWRVVSRVISMLAYLGMRQQQSPGDRLFRFAQGDKYDSLWRAGLISVFGLGTLQNLLAYGIGQLLLL